jgi:DNA recombination protein RmuC
MVNAEEETREEYLEAHVFSVRNHIDQLSAKSYDSLSELKTLDYVLMFMPMEAAFVAAIRKDPSLFEYAYRKRLSWFHHRHCLLRLAHSEYVESEYQNRNSRRSPVKQPICMTSLRDCGHTA